MQKSKLQKKEVVFQGKKLILYSLDSITWSTKKEELELIQERLELQRSELNQKLSKKEDKVPIITVKNTKKKEKAKKVA